MGNFFTWCAGSDQSILSKCPRAERIKHIGFGTLVLVPAVLAFVSMSYALSTIDKIGDRPAMYLAGGFIWALIIFAFDRFIVSTHRRKKSNRDELRSATFYLRFFFAVVLGIVISHPFVMLYFDGSITEKIIADRTLQINQADSVYQQSVDTLNFNLNQLIDRKQCLENLLTAEQSGHKVALDCGYSSGLQGNSIRTRNIEDLIRVTGTSIETERTRIAGRLDSLGRMRDEHKTYLLEHTSFDYLKRELALEELKKENRIVSLTQWFLILLFLLVDVLPVTFKTFAPYGLYDKVLADDRDMLETLDTSSRKQWMQKAYDEVST